MLSERYQMLLHRKLLHFGFYENSCFATATKRTQVRNVTIVNAKKLYIVVYLFNTACNIRVYGVQCV